MSDQQNGASPSLTQATPSKPQGKKQHRTPSAAQGQPGQGKRNNKNRQQNPAIPITQLDGTVSDSVTNASPRSKKAPRQRQGGPAGAQQAPNGQAAQVNGQKARPVSVGGPMLQGTTPVKEQAYAGPTFQASPAPNKLPMPKFMGSRSVPSAAHPAGLQARLAGEKTPPENESSPEADVVSPVPPPRDAAVHSPLDMFFQADRMEKERKASGQLSPEAARRPMPPGTEPRNPFHNGNRNSFLQGLHDDQPSPKTVPPNSRPNYERARSSPGVASPPASGNNDASTQALKNLLFNTPAESNTPPPQRPQSGDAAKLSSGFDTPSPFTRRSGPSTPTPNQQQNDYALHYGNRNLSPMFQAARETPTRPSNLRQQLDQSQPAEPRQQLSPNAFSRSFLDQQIRTSNNTSQLPPGLISNSDPSLNSFSQHQRGVPQGNNGFGNQANGAPSPRNSGSRDIKGMEDDLRRMLKLS